MIQLDTRIRQVIRLIFCAVPFLGTGVVLHVLAQSGDAWTMPVNVSQSGAASHPVIAIAPNGTLHVLWWDSLEGELYARTTSVTGTTWAAPTNVEQIIGKRQVDPQTKRVTLTAPRDVRMLSDARGNVHAFWFDTDNQLLNAQTQGAAWSNATTLADAALSMEAQADVIGGLHLAYVRSVNSPSAPAGLYYRVTAGTGWSTPVLVYPSSYFRTAKPEEAHVSVASDGQGQTLVTWDDPHLAQSLYARSADGGRTWSEPQAVSSDPTGQVAKARVASTPSGEFLLIWQNTAVGGCGLTQRRSTDGGQTWSTPERILTAPSRCPERWAFALEGESPSSGRGRLWLLGMPRSDAENTASNMGLLAAWDGQAWSKSTDVSLSFRDTTTRREVFLSCLGMALAGNSVGVVGCDAGGDVWAARNAVGLDNLLPTLKPIWSAPEILSDRTGPVGLPAMAADDFGKLYAIWSQSVVEGAPGTALYTAMWDGGRWARATQAIRPPSGSTGVTAGEQPVSKAEQPALAADRLSRLHAVWSGGTSGEILYSWAYARDFTSAQGWAEPVALPTLSTVGSWPDIVADPRGDVLHAIYAVPFNEGRGIYYVRSNDGGGTWLTPTVVFNAAMAGWDSADKPRLALDANANVLHAVWLRATLPGGTGPQVIAYARSTDGGQTWSAPVQVADGAVDWPRVIVAGSIGQVHLFWNQARSKSGFLTSVEVWGQYSLDGGQRWTEAARLRKFEEVSGPVSVASDGAGGLYLVGVGQTTNGESALYYSRWNGLAWSERETLGLGQDATLGNAAVAALAPGVKRLNVLLRESMMGQTGAGRFEIAATGREIAAAPVVEPAPTFTPLPTATPAPTATPRPTPTARPQLPTTDMSQSQSGLLQGVPPLVAGAALAMLLILVAVFGRVVWTARR